MSTKLKWQQKILRNISEMNNVELVENTLSAGGGDDYDGCFTERGQWEYDGLIAELNKRLAQCGFYTTEQYQTMLDQKSEPYQEALSDFYKATWSSPDNIKPNNKYEPGTEDHRQYNLGWDVSVRENPHYFQNVD